MGQIDGRHDPDEEESSEAAQAKPVTKRALNPLVKTILTGASFQNTWRGSGLPAAAGTDSSRPQPDGSGVHKLASKAVGEPMDRAASAEPASPERAETAPFGTHPSNPAAPSSRPVSDVAPRPRPEDMSQLGLADTQQQARSDLPPAPSSADGGKRSSRRGAFNPKLGRTLRMEIAIGSNPPADSSQTSPPKAASSTPPITHVDAQVVAGATQRIGTRRDSDTSSQREPTRSTDPFGSAGFKTWNNPPGPGPRPASSRPPPLPRGQNSAFPSLAEQQSSSPTLLNGGVPWQAPRRRDRVGDRTVITKRGVSKRDWMFVGLLVCAVGVTAGMLLTNSNDSPEAASQDSSNVEQTVNPALEGQQDPQAAHEVANVTEIVSNPPNAEVVFGGAVIGNTPVRVARATFDADYLVRLGGYNPQLVRVSQNSPATIVVTLNRDAPAAAAPTQNAPFDPNAATNPGMPSPGVPSPGVPAPSVANPGAPSPSAPIPPSPNLSNLSAPSPSAGNPKPATPRSAAPRSPSPKPPPVQALQDPNLDDLSAAPRNAPATPPSAATPTPPTAPSPADPNSAAAAPADQDKIPPLRP